MTNFPGLDLLIAWIIDRVTMQRRREAGETPLTADPIMATNRFCNANVQDDPGSRVIFDTVTQPYTGHPGLIVGLAVCRFTNEPEVIEAVKDCIVPFDAERFVAIMTDRKARGLSLSRRAYVIPGGVKGELKAVSLTRDLFTPLANSVEALRPKPGDTVEAVFERLRAFPYLDAGFLAAQIVRDLKQVEPLRSASDWKTFVRSGPGSQRGANRICGATTAAEIERERPEAEWRALFEEIVALAAPRVAEHGIELDAQSWQNTFCELDKYLRFKSGDMKGARRYAPAGKAPPRRAAKPKPAPVEAPAPSIVRVEAPPPAPHALPELAAARDPTAPHVLRYDIETRSRVDLEVAGAAKYATDLSTEILCLAYAVDDEPVQLWVPAWVARIIGVSIDPVPREFFEAATNPNWTTEAHNAAFEIAHSPILESRYGFPAISTARRVCSMAIARAAALPGKLEKAVDALGLPYPKDKAGHALMMRMCSPRQGGGWIEDAASLERLCAYCRRDVEAERALSKALPPLTADEQKLWELDARINGRGFAVDVPLLEAAHRVVTTTEAELQAEFRELTGLKSVKQVDKFTGWLAAHDCAVDDVQKGTLRHALRRKGLTPEVRRAIELRLQLAHSAADKVEALLAWRGADNRVRGSLIFHGTSTGRWSGFGVQPQNFKRDSEGTDAKIAAVMAGGVGLESPVEAVGDIARAMIVASPEHRLMIGDFSGIESRVLAWASGQQSKLDMWVKFDRTGALADDPYYILGRACGLAEDIARAKGKICDLAFGFGGGVGAWRAQAPEDDNTDETTVERYRDAWRGQHRKTKQFWYALDDAAIKAIRNPGTDYCGGRFTYRYDAPFLRVKLPSGRSISYPFAEIRAEPNRFGNTCATFLHFSEGKFVPCNYGQGAWHGIWCENAISGTARDLLAAAIQRLEAAGYPIVLTVHDEIVAEVPDGFGSPEEFRHLITTLPDWAEGLPIAAKVRESQRFSKPDAGTPIGDQVGETAIDGALDDHGGDDLDGGLGDDHGGDGPDIDPGAGSIESTIPGADLGITPGTLTALLGDANGDSDGQAERHHDDDHAGDWHNDDNGAVDGSVDGAVAARAGRPGNGRAAGNGYQQTGSKFHCPWHEDKTPSLQVYEDHYHCYGCGRHGPLSDLPANWAEAAPTSASTDNAATLTYAHRLWDAAQPIAGTLAERYLAETRRIDISALPATVNDALRFHPNCPFGPNTWGPCLVALYRDAITDAPAGIHRIGLTTDAKKLGRLTLGSWATPRAIKLWPAAKQLYLGEGIETVLAAATKIPYRDAPMRPAWAAGSSGNIGKFPAMAGVDRLIVLIDHDANGAAQKSARICAERWKAAGRAVLLLTPRRVGADFNDMI